MDKQLKDIIKLSEAAQELLLRSTEQGKDWNEAIEVIMAHISVLADVAE